MQQNAISLARSPEIGVRVQTIIAAALISQHIVARSLYAQNGAPSSSVERADVLNAVLRFRADLAGDSTRIAACRLAAVGDSAGTGRGLDERFRRALLTAVDTSAPPFARCSVYAFARASQRVLFITDVVEVRRDGGPGTPPLSQRQYELSLQLLVDPQYREFHRYVVSPTSVRFDPTLKPETFSYDAWRVSEYKLVGWDFHWGDNAGHSSSVRPPE
jgi:hypothetical protein